MDFFFQETDINLLNVTDPNNSPASSLDHEDTNEKVKKILVEQISSDWMGFAHLICLNGFYNILEEIQNKNINNQSRLEIFLKKINEINRLNYEDVIANCLYTLKRFDILLYVALDEKFAKVKNFLIEHLSTDWKEFAHETHLNDIETIVKHIEQNNEDDKSKMASFLEKLSEIDQFQYKDKIQNSLSTLGKFNILFGVVLDENDETVQCILVENVAADWKRLAYYTRLHDIESIVEQIDHDYSDDQSKMTAFLIKLNELDPLDYKMRIVNFLNDASRFDVLFKLALNENFENTMKFLLEHESSDWMRFARYACLYEVNSIIENIDQKNTSNKMKMKALLEKLYEINPLQFKELIRSTLITMKRFSVLSTFEVDGCHGKEKEEKEVVKVNNERNEKHPLINGIFLNAFIYGLCLFLTFYAFVF